MPVKGHVTHRASQCRSSRRRAGAGTARPAAAPPRRRVPDVAPGAGGALHPRGVRGAVGLVFGERLDDRGGPGPAASAWARESASSIAWQAPWARYCSIGCAASPSSAIRPRAQLDSGSRSYIGHHRSRHRNPVASRTRGLQDRNASSSSPGPPHSPSASPVARVATGCGTPRPGCRTARAERVLHEVQAGADPGDHVVRLGPRGHLVHPGRAAVGDEARADRSVGGDQCAEPECRPSAPTSSSPG